MKLALKNQLIIMCFQTPLFQDMGADDLSECVQDFYQNLSERLQTQFKGTASLLR